MENAETSVNINPMDFMGSGFHGMDPHKKALIAENSEMESGYVSNCSISHSHVTASSWSNSARFLSFKKSLDLETISENKELKGNSNSFDKFDTRNIFQEQM